MDATAFGAWLGGVAGLSEAQRQQALQVLAYPTIPAIAEVVLPAPGEARPADPVGVAGIAELGQRRVASLGCPHCANRDVVRWCQASELPRYRCKACSRTFNALTKTPLAHLRLKEKWAEQTQAMIDGVSTAKAAVRCGVH
jgi:hypothetical protein